MKLFRSETINKRALEHAEQFGRDRETILSRIAGYHKHINGCTAEMNK